MLNIPKHLLVLDGMGLLPQMFEAEARTQHILNTAQPNPSQIAWGKGTSYSPRLHTTRTTVGDSIADHLRRDPSATVSIFGMEEKHVAALIQERQEEGKYLMDELGRVAPELSKVDYEKFMRTIRARAMA
ncbi:MAG: hypothetical protein RSP_18000 [Rhodanobacter sp.]